jgi:hypothetical protein
MPELFGALGASRRLREMLACSELQKSKSFNCFWIGA